MLVSIIRGLFSIYTLLLLIRVLGSWFGDFQKTSFMCFIAQITDPYLNIFRKIIPPIGGMIDISPIVAFFALQIVEYILMRILR